MGEYFRHLKETLQKEIEMLQKQGESMPTISIFMELL